jgi:hypothetical protein
LINKANQEEEKSKWIDKYGNSSFPIRYKIEFSNLRYAQEPAEVQESDKEENIEHVIFKPYDALVHNKDGYAKNILLALTAQASRIAVCMCYTVTNDSCRTGSRFLHACSIANIRYFHLRTCNRWNSLICVINKKMSQSNAKSCSR